MFPENLIISIRPTYAEAILSGVKTVELRRRIPSIEIGAKLWIYSTLPVGAVIGFAVVEDIIESTPEDIWRLYNRQAGIEQKYYDQYFIGSQKAVALLLGEVEKVNPVEINLLRTLRKSFHPPQVMLKLSEAETNSLKKLAHIAA